MSTTSQPSGEGIAKGLGNAFGIIDEAEKGETALEMIRASEYDCILLDLMMPGIDGKKFSKEPLNKIIVLPIASSS